MIGLDIAIILIIYNHFVLITHKQIICNKNLKYTRILLFWY